MKVSGEGGEWNPIVHWLVSIRGITCRPVENRVSAGSRVAKIEIEKQPPTTVRSAKKAGQVQMLCKRSGIGISTAAAAAEVKWRHAG